MYCFCDMSDDTKDPPSHDQFGGCHGIWIYHCFQHMKSISFDHHPPSSTSYVPCHHPHNKGKPSTVRVYCKAKTDYSLTIHEGKLILAPTNPYDPHQHWIKDEKFGAHVKDRERFSSFSLINKATGQAMKHSIGVKYPVEIQVRKIHCVDRAASVLPINVEDAARSDAEIEKALEAGEQLVRVNQDTRLDHRVIDLRTAANQAIFSVKGGVKDLFKQFLKNEGFREIETPVILAGASEGGAAVFKLDYKGQLACLAQSPQFHKQMALCSDFGRVFVSVPVFRAEGSDTHRHLCEFIGLDVEMEIKEHYSEVMDMVDRLFVEMFDKLNEIFQKELEIIGKQYPFKPLKYLRNTLRLTFEEGIQMLKDAGVEVDPLGDLNTESERTLGKLVLEKYGTEFYILHRYPLAVRPFYTMPCHDNEAYSNSFDVFIRGEEIISGGQRVHRAELLESLAKQRGIDVKTISTYIDSFRYGAPVHGGFGAGLERVVMLYCALDNIRKTSLFLRDPRRLEP